jgi:hypothetical protein
MGKILLLLALTAGILAYISCARHHPKGDKWQVVEGTSYKDGSPYIYLTLDAEPESTQSVWQKHTPQLHIQCTDGKTTGWIGTGQRQEESAPFYLRHTVWIQFDDRPPSFDDQWYEFKGSSVLNVPYAIRFSQQITAAKLLTLKYTPYYHESLVLRFDVRGLSAHLGKVAQDCGWRIGVPTGAPKLTEIRKVFIRSSAVGEEEQLRMAEEWRQKVQGHTCLQAVHKLKEADAVLRLDALDTTLTSKDDQTLWSRHMGYLEYKPLNRAVGCAR